MNKTHDLLDDKTKQECLERIIVYLKEEYDEEIGIIAAEEILNLVYDLISKSSYNKALADTRGVLKNTIADLNIDIDLLKKL